MYALSRKKTGFVLYLIAAGADACGNNNPLYLSITVKITVNPDIF
jgi:hypothetical protein